MVRTLLGMIIDFKHLQFWKALSPIVLTELGIAMETNRLQSPKATCPMLVTPLGISTEVKPLQYQKAPYPILMTLLGISTDVKLLHPSKASFPIDSIPSGMIYLPEYERGSRTNTWSEATIDCKLLQSQKAPIPTCVTLLGSSIVDKLLHFPKAYSPIVCTSPDMVIEVN